MATALGYANNIGCLSYQTKTASKLHLQISGPPKQGMIPKKTIVVADIMTATSCDIIKLYWHISQSLQQVVRISNFKLYFRVMIFSNLQLQISGLKAHISLVADIIINFKTAVAAIMGTISGLVTVSEFKSG